MNPIDNERRQPTSTSKHYPGSQCESVRVLVVIEGTNDIEFLKRIATIAHQSDDALPDLAQWEESGDVIFVPFGGGNVSAWTERMAPLSKPEFHLYDHELPPETDYRIQAAEAVNRRPNCQAVITRKRSLENYLHPRAIQIAGNIEVTFDDFDSVATMAAKRLYSRGPVHTPWELLSKRAQNRMAQRAKRWLNTTVAEHMTVDLLRKRDPEGEIASWLAAIGRLARTC